MSQKYFYDFSSWKSVQKNFETDFPEPPEVLAASYEYANYYGTAWVVYADESGIIWEVHGSHCSCYGLEGQWAPELMGPRSIALKMIKMRNYYKYDRLKAETQKYLIEKLEADLAESSDD